MVKNIKNPVSLQNLHFGKVFLLIILIILCSFSLATAEKITEEIVVYKYNEGYYSDYNSAYEDINSLFKTEYPEGEEYFIAKKVDGEWKLFDGFGERMLFKIEPIVKEISKGKFVNGYKFSCKKPIKTSSFSTMSLQSSGSGWYEVARAELDPSESDRESGNCYVDYKGDEVSGVQKIKSVYNDEIVYTMRTKWIQKKPNAIYRARIDYKDTGRERLRIILILEERINNSSPTITISRPGENSYFGKEKPINISGTVKDTDSGDTLTVKYTISGITAHTNKTLRTITANGNNQSFSNDISIDTSIPEGTYILKVWVEDNNGGKSSEVTRKINVDKTPPNVPSLNLDESWTNENRTFTITGGADNTGGSGLDRIEYRIGNGAWTRYSTIVTALSNSGTIQVQARAIDKVGNISSVVSKTARVDKIKPTVTITNNDTNWHSDNITVNVKHSDDGGSGVKTKQYAITNSSTKPSTGWINLASENQNVIVSNNGNNYVHVRIIDNANNETYSYKGPFKVDKIAPILNPPIAKAISGTKIKITANANDNLSGLHSTPYLYNRDGTDITNWISSNILEDENLDPNRQYAYKYKAKDSVGNVSEYSNEVKKYTKALNPEKIILKEVTGTSLTFEVINDSSNINTPETILRLEGVKDTGWHTNEVKSFNNLEPGKTYKLSINTRNGDNEENGWLNAPGNIPIEDEFGNPIYEIVTIVPVEDFKVTGSSVNSLTVSWDKADNQEYQVYLKDESGNEISNSRSNWLDNNMYTFSNLSKPNTKYIPYIITRRGTNQLPEVKIENENKAYTNAEGISRGTFESGEDYITITLSVGDTNNPSDTEYFIKNDITGQPEVKVTHDNPVWKNTNLAKESYYTYSVRVVNKNGEDSYYTRLVFENGDEASTIIPDLEIEPGKIMPDDGEYIDLDELKNHDHGDEVWFNPEVDLNNNIVQLEGDKYKVTRNRIEEIKNREEIEVINYSYSREGFGYTDWKPLEEGFFTEKLVFNMPGIYLTHWKFKNYRIESDPVLINYYVDWIAPTIEGEPAIKGQSVVTGNEFRVVINAKDNISPYLFYSTDDGLTWFLLKEGQNEIVFSNINKSSNGIQNKLTIKIADIAGNVVEKTFTVWGIEK